MRTIPRGAIVTLWIVLLPIVHAILPFGLSLVSRRHHWTQGHPGWFNELGLIGVLTGAVMLVWVLLLHFEKSPQRLRVASPFEGPGYVLTRGPYGFTRHPMHMAGIAIWLGWAVFYGSLAVALGAALLGLTFVLAVPAEERGMEKTLGEQYRNYQAQVPRWGIGKRRHKGN